MARIKALGFLVFAASVSPDVVSYNVYYAVGQNPSEDSPFVSFPADQYRQEDGSYKVPLADLNIAVTPEDGAADDNVQVHFNVAPVDDIGNIGDLGPEAIVVPLDTVPPQPISGLSYSAA